MTAEMVPRSSAPYTRLDASRKEIRLLRLLPRSGDSARGALRVETRVMSLLVRSYLPYDCISYCWGDASKVEAMTLNGCTIDITLTLGAVLRYFQDLDGDEPTVPVWLWADGLCVNQADLEERNTQVSLMGEIFTEAQIVRAWVEPPQGLRTDQEQCLACACRLALDMLSGQQDLAIKRAPIFETLIQTLFGMLSFLLLRPFWHRMWITQELVLNEDVVIYFGLLRYSLHGKEKFSRIRDNALTYGLSRCGAEIGRITSDHGVTPPDGPKEAQDLYVIMAVLQRFRSAEVCMLSRREGQVLPDRVMLLHLTTGEATLKHDYIYSMLGLVDERLQLKPDYAISYQQVYADYTFNLMQASGSLMPLSRSRPGAGAGPSWSVDYSLGNDHIPVKSCGFEFAADKTIDWYLLRRSSEQIIVNGVVLSEINSLLRLSDRPASVLVRDAVRYYHSAASKMVTPDQGDLTMPIDLVQTLTWDSHISIQKLALRTRLSQEELELHQQQFEAILRGATNELSRMITSWGYRNDSLFWTACGRLGISQHSIEVGDRLCVLGGLGQPFILRPVSQSNLQVAYKAIGVCYVAGIMDGEALEIRQAQLAQEGRSADEAIEHIVLV